MLPIEFPSPRNRASEHMRKLRRVNSSCWREDSLFWWVQVVSRIVAHDIHRVSVDAQIRIALEKRKRGLPFKYNLLFQTSASQLLNILTCTWIKIVPLLLLFSLFSISSMSSVNERGLNVSLYRWLTLRGRRPPSVMSILSFNADSSTK